MSAEPRVSNWLDAERAEYPPCPRCGAQNRPKAAYITWERGTFSCCVCAHAWQSARGDVEDAR